MFSFKLVDKLEHHFKAHLFLKTSAKFRVDEVRKVFFQILNALLDIIDFVGVIYG